MHLVWIFDHIAIFRIFQLIRLTNADICDIIATLNIKVTGGRTSERQGIVGCSILQAAYRIRCRVRSVTLF